MDNARLTDHLHREYALLHAAVASADPGSPVPTCPGWTVSDLAGHVAEVYLHKAECIRLRAFPDPWPPERPAVPPTAELETAWARLLEQFATHEPTDPAATWHDPDQTVGFWIRRMAQETAVHRIDAQLAAGVTVDPIPDDLAEDGVDELLTLFVAYASEHWPGGFAGVLAGADRRPVRVTAGSGSWLVTIEEDAARVVPTSADAPAAAQVTGDAGAMARWLWGRGGEEAVTVGGDQPLVDQLRRVIVAGTQ
jgi:uncharacterized protein (TIGR03083 family)